LPQKISLLYIGDVVGEPSLKLLSEEMPRLIDEYKANFVVVNGENINNGKGIVDTEAELLFNSGANVITTGNHVWENWKSRPLLSKNDKVIRPYNYPYGNPGYGYTIYQFPDGDNIAVIQLQGRTYMQTIDCPFRGADNVLKLLSEKVKNIIIDFHADATAEKMAMAWHVDGRVSALLGTHTHIQTADAQILPKGTAYITDVGMTGPYDSVVGMRKDIALKRFLLQTAHKYEMAENDIKICGVNVIIDGSAGQAMSIKPFIYPGFERSVY
jgi:metallophosphoesterase (TIGR00282 family)